MATITERKKADGTISYKAEIVIKKHGAVVHRTSRTFNTRKLAKDWAARKEIELQSQDVYQKAKPLALRAVIEAYIAEYPVSGRTKLLEIQRLLKYKIVDENIYTLSSKIIVDHIRERNKTVSPVTANRDLIWMTSVAKTMRATIRPKYDTDCFEDARVVLKKERLISTPQKRKRRPTKRELLRLSRGMSKEMRHIMWFAIYSCRRESEIANMRWDDINHENRTVLIRNLKDPRQTNVQKRAKLPRSAYKIIMRQPQTSEKVFAMSTQDICLQFIKARDQQGIEDLRFHDLRHEGISRLFERGLGIPQVQQVSLHSTWNTLKRYTNLDPGDLDI